MYETNYAMGLVKDSSVTEIFIRRPRLHHVPVNKRAITKYQHPKSFMPRKIFLFQGDADSLIATCNRFAHS